MNLIITKDKGLPISKIPVEIAERKGKGHPDVICDKAAEELSIELSNWYLTNFGRVLHHNVDKCVLAGGQSNAQFGGGEVIEPIYLLLVGRAVGVVGGEREKQVPIGKLAVKRTQEWLIEDLPNLNPTTDMIIDYKIRSGSTDLVGNFEEEIEIPRSNDTSIGVAFGPFSPLEQVCLKTEHHLNSRVFKSRFPEVGEDIKVMGVRNGNQLKLTVAAAMMARMCPDADHYMNVKQEVQNVVNDLACEIIDAEVSVKVNTADDPDTNLYYLTVTGTSAEHGDDGQVGRGNRASGLITPYRPMTLEAAAGKNPISHVGKTYNVAAEEIVNTLLKEESGIEQIHCVLVSEIGAPITEPQAINLILSTNNSIEQYKGTVEAITEDVMSRLPTIWRGFLERKYNLY